MQNERDNPFGNSPNVSNVHAAQHFLFCEQILTIEYYVCSLYKICVNQNT